MDECMDKPEGEMEKSVQGKKRRKKRDDEYYSDEYEYYYDYESDEGASKGDPEGGGQAQGNGIAGYIAAPQCRVDSQCVEQGSICTKQV